VNWYCVHTRPSKESQVALYLQTALGRETYFPKLTRQRTIRRVRRVVTGPLFPRYLFCRLDMSAHYRSVRYAPDVIDLVNFGDKPAVVAESIVNELMSWAGAGVDLIAIQPLLQPGDLVEITDGPMQGLHATILNQRNDGQRVAVLLSMLRYGAQMIIDRSQLAKVS
jgi:transcriptional antiterminator RfaH